MEEGTKTTFVVIPFVSGLSKNIRRICGRYNIKVTFRSGPSLRNQLSKLKDPLPLQIRSGVVYNIICAMCDKCYIRETIHRLEDRIKEHKSACIKCDTEKSALAEHARREGHHTAWEKVTILDDERRRFGLIIKEALHLLRTVKNLF